MGLLLTFFDLTTPDQASELEDALFTARIKRLLCRYCRCIITDDDQKTTREGQFIHYRTNPAGVAFEFGCYVDALGCSTLGEVTTEHTWFPGYSWKLAVCQGCGEHLGWLFKGDDSFYGLIQDRLVLEQ